MTGKARSMLAKYIYNAIYMTEFTVFSTILRLHLNNKVINFTYADSAETFRDVLFYVIVNQPGILDA